MTRFQVAICSAMLTHDVIPQLFSDATWVVTFVAAGFAFFAAIVLMLVDARRAGRSK